MSMRQQFDADKALEVLLYIAKRCPNIYNALKVLYFADKAHLNKYGRQVCGDSYVALDYGPVPSAVYGFVEYARGDGGWCTAPDAVVEALRIEAPYTIVPLREPDLDFLSESDMECLDAAIRQYGNLSFSQLKRISHRETAYKQSDHNSRIPLDAIVKSLPDGKLLLKYLND